MSDGRLPPLRAVILDMDGLVLDSETTYCHAWRRAASDLGVELSEAFCHSLFGRHADDVARALREAMGAAFEPERFHRLAEKHWLDYLESHGMARMPGLEALLDVFRRRALPYALATNSDGIYARQCLRLAGLEAEFPVIVTRDQVPLGKPEPDVFLEAARRLEAPPGLCLGVEDSATGLAAARAAGTFVVLVQRREEARRQLAEKADLALASLAELAELIEP